MTRYHKKGSIIVMVVGLLVLLAMIGTTFIIIAHMDRREAASIATAASMKQVAGGVLQQIRAKLAADLYIDDKGTPSPNDDVIYGSAANYKQQVEFPHEDYDKHLASFGPVDVGGVSTWKHLSNHESAAAGFFDVPANDPLLVDTDGYLNDGVNDGDAKLFNSGVGNRAGSKYWAAYRLIGASALMNVNSAYGPPASAAAGTVMPITNISLEALTNTATRNNVHAARNGSTSDNIATYNNNYVQRPLNPAVTYLPFDAADMTALIWGGTVPDTASGRLFEALGGQFNAAKPYITVRSASRNYIRRYTGIQDTTHRVNLNSAGATVFVDLFNAFYNAIPEGIVGFTDDNPTRRLVAAQLAVNVIDYRDAGDTPYQPIGTDMTTVGLTGVTLFGVERQPFITEAWLRMEWTGGAGGSLQQWSAIELFNPYATPVSLAGYRLKVGATTNDLQNNPGSIPAGGRIVIVNKAGEIQAVSKCQDTTLDLRQTCTLLRPTSVAGSYAPVGSVDPGEFGLTPPTEAAPDPVFAAIRRDDAVARAKYSVAVYNTYNPYTYRIGEAGCPAVGDTNLGRSNVIVDEAGLSALPVAPTPVFVRNGKLINLGEVSRIFYVGPSSSGVPLDKALASMAPNNVSNGRLYTLGAIKSGTDPQIPCACMLGDYMDALAPDTNNTGRTDTVYGRININIAPWQVIRYLPGISAMAQRDRIAKDIVAYRDLLDNTADGGTNYSGGGTARFTAIGLPDLTGLREEAGFASPGEIAIPLAKIVTLPRNNYGSSAPDCYRISDGDDGLGDITGDLSKYDIYYAWLSNQVTVRSDVYIAYIRVQIGSDPAATGGVRKYVAVLDRSNCTSSDKLPDVLMFAELK